jgi:peptide/nickel transport system substrate-binding protein
MRTLLISFFTFLKKEKVPTKEHILELRNQPLSPFKVSLFFSCLLVVSLFLATLLSISNHFSVEVPDHGGTLSFGVIGAPRFINPLLSSNETDEALTYLVYSGLVKNSDDGTLIPVLAQSFTTSPDKKEYQFMLKDNLTFSNKTALDGRDILFTFETKKRLSLISDPNSDWSNISIRMLDNKTIIISTTGSEESLTEKLSLGIVSKSLWETVDFENIKDSNLNIKPVGEGPFVIKNITYTNTVPKEILLERNKHFIGPAPYISRIRINIFANQLDLKTGLLNKTIDSTDMLYGTFIDDSIKNNFSISQIPTDKNISLFVSNKNRPGAVSTALFYIDQKIDRKKIVDIIENGYGIPVYSSGKTSTSDGDTINELLNLGYKQNESRVLTKSGSEISASIVMKKEEQLMQTGDQLAQELLNFGILTELKVFDQGLFLDQVNQGEYPFILGTQSDIPTGYQNLIPLYTKTIPNITIKSLHSSSPSKLKMRSEIFRNIEDWYVRTDKVWKWFN